VEVADPAPGEFRFETVSLGEADGGAVLASGGGLVFAADAPGRTATLGRVPAVPGRRYDLRARIYARARPDLAESRYMAYAAIIHGARGLLWWGTHTVPDGDPIWLDVAALARELAALGPALLGPTSLREVRAGDPAVEAALLQDGTGGLLLLAANRSRAPVRSRIEVSGLPLASCERVDGGARPIRANRIEEEFEPLGVGAWRLR
ncbi:MAG TPA: hypothetical protein VFP65_30120, partial [Anaeromyxobacteraceae bacterium]|nr:hypothetical protein [Anaeromyxobacteraceae bacterium]